MKRKKNGVGHAFSEHVFITKKQYFQERNQDNNNSDLVRKLPVLMLGIVFVVFVLRLLTLQVVQGAYYDRLSNENRIRTTLVPAPRGIIFDRNGQALVRNSQTYGIIENEEVSWLSHEEALRLLEKKDNQVISIPQREYLYKDVFSHVLGYIGQLTKEETLQPQYSGYGYTDFTGRMGLEDQYESILHGENGRQLVEVDSMGNYVRTLGEDFSIPGDNLTTTLDLEIQKSVFDAMLEVESGAAIVSDPRDGAIRAILSKPTFDPNLFTKNISYEPDGGYQSIDEILSDKKNPLLNRTISGSYPPGSTFKIITATAGLEENAISPTTKIEDTGVRTIGGLSFGTWNYLQYGKLEEPLNVVGAIRRSNDIFFYVLSEKVGPKKFSEWAGKFGMGKILNVDIPGEIGGVVPGPSWKERVIGEDWYLGDTYNMSIGQGFVQATPLQTNFMTNIIANRGTLYRPHLVSESKKVIREDFVDPRNIDLIREGMLQACQTGGTGYPFFNFTVRNSNLTIDGMDFKEGSASSSATTDDNRNEKPVNISVGCKTGTSETFDHTDPHAWFTVFAPFNNPEISVTILVEHGGEGSQVAAPIAKEILTRYFEEKK